MKTQTNERTRSTTNAHEGQTVADTNKTRILRTRKEYRRAVAEILAAASAHRLREYQPPVCAYSRKDALAESREAQVRPEFIQQMREDWDIVFECPVFLTRKAIETCEIASGRSLYADTGPLWSIFCVLDHACDCPVLGRGSPTITRIPFEVSFGIGATTPCVCLNLSWSTTDIDDQRPSFTVMLPEED